MKVGLWYVYSMFMVYLSYIYGIFIVCCGMLGYRDCIEREQMINN